MESRTNSVIIRGVVSDEKNNRLKHVRVQLCKKVKKKRRFYYMPVDRGMTDDEGVYVFRIKIDQVAWYKVLVIEEVPKILID
ncbi:MAG: hypothetical protein ACRCW2_10520 [Cellulosilyticaceae bacterium]